MGGSRLSKWDRAVRSAQHRNRLYGSLGKYNGDNTYSYEVTGKAGYVYVTVQSGNDNTIYEAIFNGVPRQAARPVLLEQTAGGEWMVVGSDPERALAYQGGNLPGLNDVAYHTHMIGSGLEYPIEGRLLYPGLGFPVSGLTIEIAAFVYLWDGITKVWPGGYLDLTSYRPGTAGHHAWVKYGIDPTTTPASAIAVTGTSQATTLDLVQSDIEAIDFLYYICRGAVKLTNGQTASPTEDDFTETRPWANEIGRIPYEHSNTLTANYTVAAARNAFLVSPATLSGTWTINGVLKVI